MILFLIVILILIFLSLFIFFVHSRSLQLAFSQEAELDILRGPPRSLEDWKARQDGLFGVHRKAGGLSRPS
jgi:hypothetical protein